MTTPKRPDEARLTVRMPQHMHAEIQAAADYNARTVNAEIVERLRASQLVDQLRIMARENADMRAMIKEMHDLAIGK